VREHNGSFNSLQTRILVYPKEVQSEITILASSVVEIIYESASDSGTCFHLFIFCSSW
jgi:hypothetical protein